MKDRPWVKQYDRGVPYFIEYPPVSLHFYLEEAARKNPDSACTIFRGARISYSEMNAITSRLAAGLAELGINKGYRVGIFMRNIPQFVMAYFAILKLGAVVVATNPQYTAREIEYQLNDAGVEVMLVMSNYYHLLKAVQPKTAVRSLVVTNLKETLPPVQAFLYSLTKEKQEGSRVQLADGDYWMKDLIERHSPQDLPKVDVTPDDVALFQYSGGTTGISKGAVALHRNLVANTLQFRSWITNTEEGKDVLLMATHRPQ